MKVSSIPGELAGSARPETRPLAFEHMFDNVRGWDSPRSPIGPRQRARFHTAALLRSLRSLRSLRLVRRLLRWPAGW